MIIAEHICRLLQCIAIIYIESFRGYIQPATEKLQS